MIKVSKLFVRGTRSISTVSSGHSFEAKDIKIERRVDPMNKPDPYACAYTFGKQFTDHMFMVDWSKEDGGWGRPLIREYGPMKVPTSSTCLHYGINAYEGFSVLMNEKTGEP